MHIYNLFLLCPALPPSPLLSPFSSATLSFIISCLPYSPPSQLRLVHLPPRAVTRSGRGVNCLGAPQSMFLKEKSCICAPSYLFVLYRLTTLSHRSQPRSNPAETPHTCAYEVFLHACTRVSACGWMRLRVLQFFTLPFSPALFICPCYFFLTPFSPSGSPLSITKANKAIKS